MSTQLPPDEGDRYQEPEDVSPDSLPAESAQRTSDCEPTTSAELLTRGARLLRCLEQEAAAARAEARRAELEAVLSEARQGDTQRLAHWLADYERLDFQRRSGAAPALPLKESEGQANDGPSEFRTKRIEGWEDLLNSARSRLYRHVRQRQRSGRTPDDVSAVAAAPGQAEKRSANPKMLQRGRLKLKASSKRLGASRKGPASKSRSPAGPAAPTGSAKKQLARIWNADRCKQKKQSRVRSLVFSRAKGAIASLIAHLLLVVGLAVITLQMPSPPAGMSFEAVAADVPEQTLELTQPLEASEPQAPEETREAPQPALDFNRELAEASSRVQEALRESTLVPARLTSATGAAMAAEASSLSSAMRSSASFFGAAANGNCFCYVIDGSGSMRNGPWEAAKSELLKSLASLQAKQRFYIIFFHRELNAIPMPGQRGPASRALYATPENLEHARRWLDTLKIGIGAPPNKALAMAISKEPDAIYLLTDGVTTVDVAEFLRGENRIDDLILGEQVRVPIHAIAFYSLKGQQLLKRIAAENRGQYVYVPDPRKKP